VSPNEHSIVIWSKADRRNCNIHQTTLASGGWLQLRSIWALKGTSYLGYRDLPSIIKKYSKGKYALDYGCGTGYSTSLLKSLNFDVVGADISTHMLDLARQNHPEISFIKSKIGHLPFADSQFDLVLSTFVLFDIPSLDGIVDYLREAKRVLKQNGIFIVSTGSEYFHLNNWLTISINTENNLLLKSGENYLARILDADITFNDFFYSDSDYSKAFTRADMNKIRTYHPLGISSDRIAWKTEWNLPPYVIYVCSPSK
jgi:SAM-dependent methyltransferase